MKDDIAETGIPVIDEAIAAARQRLRTPPTDGVMYRPEDVALIYCTDTLADIRALVAKHHALGALDDWKVGQDCPVCTQHRATRLFQN